MYKLLCVIIVSIFVLVGKVSFAEDYDSFIVADTKEEIQSAINTLESGNGGTILILPGTYTFDSGSQALSVSGTKKIIIQGSGHNTVLNLNYSGINGIVVGSDSEITNGFTLRDLYIYGKSIAEGDNFDTGIGIILKNHSGVNIDNVNVVRGAGGVYIYAEGEDNYCADNTLSSLYIMYCNDYGIKLETIADGGTNWLQNTTLNNSWIAHSGKNLWLVRGGNTHAHGSNFVSDCYIETTSSLDSLLTIVGSDYNRFSNIHLDGVTGYEMVSIDSDSGGNSFNGYIIAGNINDVGNNVWFGFLGSGTVAPQIDVKNNDFKINLPSGKDLKLSGNLDVSNRFKISGLSSFDSATENIYSPSTGALGIASRGNVEIHIDSNNNSNNDFSVISDGSNHRLTVKDTGNVGIGQINPQAKLDINGELKVTDLNTGTSQGVPVYIGSDNKLCLQGQCN